MLWLPCAAVHRPSSFPFRSTAPQQGPYELMNPGGQSCLHGVHMHTITCMHTFSEVAPPLPLSFPSGDLSWPNPSWHSPQRGPARTEVTCLENTDGAPLTRVMSLTLTYLSGGSSGDTAHVGIKWVSHEDLHPLHVHRGFNHLLCGE